MASPSTTPHGQSARDENRRERRGRRRPLVSFSAALDGPIEMRRCVGSPPPSTAVPNKLRDGTKKKGVSFADERYQASIALFHEVEGLQDYTDDEHAQTWFARMEYDAIRASCKDLTSRMGNHESIRETDEVSTRGLEGRSKAGVRHRREVQADSTLSVLREQERQQSEGRTDPEALAMVYRQSSYHSLQAAANMGRRDAFAVQENRHVDGFVGHNPCGSAGEVRRAGVLRPHPIVQPRDSACGRRRGVLNLGLQAGRGQANGRILQGASTSQRGMVRTASHRRAAAA